jgi:hypothetical protein
MFADFGLIGLIAAAVTMAMAFSLCVRILLMTPSNSIFIPGVFGVAFDLISSIEGNLTGELASIRAAVIFLILSLLFRFAGQIISRRAL